MGDSYCNESIYLDCIILSTFAVHIGWNYSSEIFAFSSNFSLDLTIMNCEKSVSTGETKIKQ